MCFFCTETFPYSSSQPLLLGVLLFQKCTHNAHLFQFLDQFAVLVQLQHNIAATHELPVDEDLRNRRPIGELLDALPQILVLQHVMTVVRDAVHAQDLNDGVAEAAFRCLRNALHEHDHFVVLHQLTDLVLVARHFSAEQSETEMWNGGLAQDLASGSY